MLKQPSNLKRAKFFDGLFLVLLVACAAAHFAARAQQPTKTEQQVRPRRATTAPTTQPTPTAPDAPTTPQRDVAPKTVGTPRPTTSSVEEVGEDDVVRVETQLISVPVAVKDRAGRPLTNLRADNFAVFEDNRPQRVANFQTTDAPFEVALLLDTSGSTRAEVALIRRAANAFIDALRPGDRVAILSFNTAEEGAQKLATVEVKNALTDDREQLRAAIENIGSSNGTPFYDALARVASEVFGQPPRAELRGRRALVALTDGVDSTSEADYADVREPLLRAGVLCYFVQVNTEDFVEDRLLRDCQDDGRLSLSHAQLQRYRRIFVPRADAEDYSNFCQLGLFERMQISRALYNLARREMNQLARDSGGKTFNALDLRDARSAFAQVAADIGKQYSLGYYSTNKARDGQFRHIRVELRGLNNAQVTAREGYQAPKS